MKKILALILVFVLCSSTSGFAAMFPDTNGHWAESYIEALTMEGVINGMGDGSFEPDSFVTREQFLKMLLIVTSECANERLAFENPPKLNLIIEKSPFSDVETSRWSYYYISQAYGRIIFGEEYGENFQPVKDITREEAAVWMARALNLSEGECDFADKELIGKPGLVGAAFENGLITGFPDGTFAPGEGLTRAQAAVMLQRAGQCKVKIMSEQMETELKSVEKDLDHDGTLDKIKVIADGERYVVEVNGMGVIGGFSTAEECKFYLIDIDKNDSYQEFAVAEDFYGSGALAIYRYTGKHFYMMGYIESVGGIALRTDNTPIGDDWGAICVNADGTLTANIGEQFVHTMLLRKQFKLNEKNRLVPASDEFYTIGSHSDFIVANTLSVPFEDSSREGIVLEEGYAGKIVKTDLKNWLYIETGSGDSGWVYVQDDGLVGGEPISYYLEGLNFAG